MQPVDGDYGFDPDSLRFDTLGEYDVVTYEGASLDESPWRPGHPQLPVLTKWFLLPDETKIEEVVVTPTDWEAFPGTYLWSGNPATGRGVAIPRPSCDR